MTKHDYFAEIAMTKHPFQADAQESEPLPLPDSVYTISDKAAPEVSEQTQTEHYEQFQSELANLRAHYKPFMSDHATYPKPTTKIRPLETYAFRYAQENEQFKPGLSVDESWESVVIPDYRGPAGEKGQWRAFYHTTFQWSDFDPDHAVVIRFQCVDYKARVYLNDQYVGSHEGFFAPFEFEINHALQKDNVLVVEIENEISILGSGPVLDGDKIYAATGPGWDDPQEGWHHCPPGAGIFGAVTIEQRPLIHISDIFVRPDIDNHFIEIRMGVNNYTRQLAENYELQITTEPRNFSDSSQSIQKSFPVQYVGLGQNEYRYRIPVDDYRLWTPDQPWLYAIKLQFVQQEMVISAASSHFGMRKFYSDEQSEPKGKLFLNNEPIILRGANEMGHLQQCVMTGDFDQLIDDLLIAKICNCNYYRITQRPVQNEIYDYCDMLGMMNQCDFPLFSFLRRNQVWEAAKQVGEMEKLVRNHPSTIMTTFINEAVCLRMTDDPGSKFSKRYMMKGHRHLFRDELEAFFVAARKIIYIENPDRVIKNVEGDYDPPTAEGAPDFHCYTMWYTNHAMPYGKLHKGFMPPVKPGWFAGCGEYGAEGLDYAHIMDKYPKTWIEPLPDGRWLPDKIIRAQTYSVHGDWYKEQSTQAGWIEKSQLHQADATKIMTDAYRRRADLINHTAIHLLIDAWPSGWMKTLVGCDRMPKPAFYAYKQSLEPLRAHLRCDHRTIHAQQVIKLEGWLLNDTAKAYDGTFIISARIDGRLLRSWSVQANVDQVTAACAGVLSFNLSDHIALADVPEKCTIDFDTAFYTQNSEEGYGDAACIQERLSLTVINNLDLNERPQAKPLYCLDDFSENLAQTWSLNHMRINNTQISQAQNALYLLSEEAHLAEADSEALYHQIESGASAVLLLQERENTVRLHTLDIETARCPEVFYVAAEGDAAPYSFSHFYNKHKDYIDFVADHYIKAPAQGEDLVYSYKKSGFDQAKGNKPKLPVIKKINIGKGSLYLVALLVDGRAGANPAIDYFMTNWAKQK